VADHVFSARAFEESVRGGLSEPELE